jgi:hypothetical protein
MVETRYLLLMRHAKRRRGTEEDSSEINLKDIAASLRNLSGRYVSQDSTLDPFPVLTRAGYDETVQVIKKLKAYKGDNQTSFDIASIIHADSDDSGETARLVIQEWDAGLSVPLQPESILTPKNAFQRCQNKANRARTLSQMVTEVVCSEASKSWSHDKNAVLVVGHEPFLGWIGTILSGSTYPITNSEILCFELTEILPNQKPVAFPRGLLSWTISPTDNKTLADLREKIRGKMEIAKLLSAFIGAGLGFLASNMADHSKIDALSKQLPALTFSTVLILISLILYLTTMCSYDTLLMPVRFWGEKPAQSDDRPCWIVERPPSSDLWVLYQNMLHVWEWQFIPATYCLVLGLLTFITATFLNIVGPHTRWTSVWVVVGGLLATSLICLTRVKWRRLRGVDDELPTSVNKDPFWRVFRRLGSWRRIFGPWLGSTD